MNSLFRKVVSRSKDSLLKESLQTQLVACVRDIQLDHAHSGQFQSSLEAAEAFCTVLEAIFIHGIKETLADKMAIAMGDPDSRPEPNFWPALLIFSHREIIDQIGRLNFISTDVGRCRAWLRMALNESLLSSYLQSMLTQNSALNSFYKRAAYIRDTELLDMFVTLVSGIEDYPFNLACNSSLLNLWTNQPLLMSGVWNPAIKSCPITSGTDIASILDFEDSRIVDEDSLSSVASLSSFYESPSALNEDEALKRILGADAIPNEDKDFEKNFSCSETSKTNVDTVISNSVKTTEIIIETNKNGDVAADKVIHETHFKKPENDERAKEVLESSLITDNEVEFEKHKLQSYHSLVESYNETSTTSSKMPDLQNLLQKFQKPSISSESASTENDSESVDKLDFEVVADNFDPSDIPEFAILIQQISRIATEQGLDSQNYICKSCSQHIGVNFREAKVCGLSGAYYCSECFGTDPTKEYWVIPARIIFNWDFHQYSVSNIAANFLSQTQTYPLFDMRTINNKIYIAVEEMARLKEIRVRLKFLADYLKTCRGNAFETLQRMLWPRDYLYENLHHYSLADLIQVPSGTLEAALQKAVDLARTHVVSCDFCMQQGFICELCKNPKVVFPFDLDSTSRCDVCGTVYHAKCLQPGQLCRKCCRIQQRQIQRSSS